jgi:NADH dehydrogenase (ubiquinone) 1 alpha subcomplex subunit 13
VLRELNREEMYSRIYMLPFLQAEEDRDLYRREMAQVAREREIMKDVEGWNVSALAPGR